MEQQLPVDTGTIFAIGSISKSFTVTGLGMLVDAGELDWDRPVRDYLPEFQLHDPVATAQMTARDLVTHRSGLPRHDFVWYGDSSVARSELVHRLRFLKPNKEFRSTWQYQNLMYVTAGVLAERITGDSWEDFTRQRIIEPLAMRETNFSVTTSQQADNFALPYVKPADQVERVPFHDIDSVGPAGSINSNVDEMIRYVQFHIAKGKYGNTQLLSASNATAMQTPQMVMPGTPPDVELGHTSYGLGLMITTYRGRPLIHHGGGIDGFAALLSFLPNEQAGVIVLTNLGGRNPAPTIVTRGVYDRLLGLDPIDWVQRTWKREQASERTGAEADQQEYTRRKQGTSPSHDLADYAGQFDHPGYGRITIEHVDEVLRLTTGSGLSVPLKHFHYDVFQTVKDRTERFDQRKVTFFYDKDGEIDRLAIPFERFTDDIVFHRAADAEMTERAFLERFVGKYALESKSISIDLKDDHTLTLTVPGQPPYQLVPGRRPTFDLKGLNGYRLRFKETADGGAAEFVLFQPDGTFVAKRVADQRSAYQRPPRAVTEILDAPPTPLLSISPTRKHLVFIERLAYPTIDNLSAPMLRLAGTRLNPRTNGPHRAPRNVGLVLRTLGTGEERRIKLPEEARINTPRWSPDGTRLAFLNTTDHAVELWVVGLDDLAARKIPGLAINAASGSAFLWRPDSRSLLVQAVVANRGEPPSAPGVPAGPTIQESDGSAGPARTYQDLLQDAHDEALFDYYFTSQLMRVQLDEWQATPVGKPHIFRTVDVSPDGEHIFVARLQRPYSYQLPAYRFPAELEIWDAAGRLEFKLASLPLQDQIPIQGVPTGPRSARWRPTEAATLVWIEALDGGDPRNQRTSP